MIYPIIIYNLFEYFLNLLALGQQGSTPLSLQNIKEVQGNVLFWLGILQLVFLFMTFLLSIFISHRIAGPLFKLKKAMEEAKGGNFDQRITFRKNDHFTELQDTFNEMVQNLSIRRR